MMQCLLCNYYFKNSRSLAAHIRQSHTLTSKEYYDLYLMQQNENICVCGNITAFKGIAQGYCDFCSYACAEETRREKISLVKKGKPNIKLRGYKQAQTHIKKRIKTGKEHHFYGICGEAHPNFGKKGMSGSSNPNWKGGISKKPNYSVLFTKTLKDTIRCRDGNICQLCGVTQESLTRKLSVHHIDYDKQNCDNHNLISLCVTCHSKTNFN